MRRLMSFFVAALLLLAVPAAAWTARNGLQVAPTGRAGEVVVEFHGLVDQTDYWCAAGDYVIRVMGLSSATRLYRSATPRKRGQGYMFTIDKADATPTSGISSFGKDRDNTSVSAGHAQGAFFRAIWLDRKF